MNTISRRNVNDNYGDGLWLLKISGVVQESRNGTVIVAPGPVVNSYTNPRERVLFDPIRDANPFFHFFEALWMLAGRRDVEYVAQFVSRMREYSDDGILFGAYGYRWRRWFETDQLADVIRVLSAEPDSRRAVLTMWDPDYDLGSGGKDLPCNTHAYVSVSHRNTEPELDLTVCCRSNDAIWGCYGANVVHFSFLQEYIACALKLDVGRLVQFSHNFHVYPDMPRFEKLWAQPESEDLYALTKEIRPGPELFSTGTAQEFDSVLADWLETPNDELTCYPFLSGVAYPMWRSFQTRSTEWANKIDAPDWRYAAVSWLHRRGET